MKSSCPYSQSNERLEILDGILSEVYTLSIIADSKGDIDNEGVTEGPNEDLLPPAYRSLPVSTGYPMAGKKHLSFFSFPKREYSVN